MFVPFKQFNIYRSLPLVLVEKRFYFDHRWGDSKANSRILSVFVSIPELTTQRMTPQRDQGSRPRLPTVLDNVPAGLAGPVFDRQILLKIPASARPVVSGVHPKMVFVQPNGALNGGPLALVTTKHSNEVFPRLAIS